MNWDTKIEWCDGTWNPVGARLLVDTDRHKAGKTGHACTKVLTGCQHCYAESWNRRFGTGLGFSQAAFDKGQVEFFLKEKELQAILRARETGRSVFVGDMTDLWHPNVPDEWVDRVMAACVLRPDLDFCFLTKRPERMAASLTAQAPTGYMPWECIGLVASLLNKEYGRRKLDPATLAPIFEGLAWPFPNVYLGMSASNQPDLDAGIGHVMQLAAAGWKTYLSLEPLVGPVDVGRCLNCWCPYCGHDEGDIEERCVSCGKKTPAWLPICVAQGGWHDPDRDTWHSPIDAVIVGGETGPGARPMHPDWVRAIRDQCEAAGVPFFFKHWGEWAPFGPDWVHRAQDFDGRGRALATLADGNTVKCAVRNLSRHDEPIVHVYRVGRKRAGRLLDGVIHDATPWHLEKVEG